MPTVLDRLHDERTSLLDQVDSVTSAAADDDRDLSTAEQELIDRCHTRIADEIDPQLERIERIERTRTEHNRAVLPHVAPPNGAPVPVPVGTPELVYRTFAEYARDVLVTRYDAIAQRAGPNARAAAADRIERVVANTLTTDIPGLIRPQYLSDFAQVIDASRPLVSTFRRVGLESGTLRYPSITQRPIVGKQTTEKTETPSQKMTVVFVDVVADTYAGSGDLSWQAINWSTPNALELWFTLAAEQYAIQTEAAAGTVVAAATTMATPAIPATPTLADWMTAITAAAGVIYSTSRRRPDTVYADITTGYSIMGLVSNVAPVFIPTGGFSLASGQGTIGGLRLVISAGLPAKTVVVADSQSLLAAETPGSPVELRAVEPAIGGMEVGVIGAFVAKLTDAGAARKLTIP
jgi:HK97 family phage major capsid protein